MTRELTPDEERVLRDFQRDAAQYGLQAPAIRYGFITRGDEIFEWCESPEGREEAFLCRKDSLAPGETITGRWLVARGPPQES